jgi:hypothetical protein
MSMSQHLVLLSDSILDNAAYVPGRCPAVIDQVQGQLPVGWRATLLAVDGSVIDDVHRQLDPLPHDNYIIRVAREFKFPVLELRAICTDAADFVAQIEPSLHGGAKIAEAICQSFVGHDFGTRQTVIFP